MMWFLLYPLRRTTLPPRLSADHPIRRAFYRHGKTTAQHWLVAMLISVAIAMAFSYPTILLSGNPTAGVGAHPHHVWTTAKPYEGDVKHADVELRQIWVHGSYMKALDKDVLMKGLDIQQELVGSESMTSVFQPLNDTLHSSTLSWGYHSPLMYWNSSRQTLNLDEDVLRTINEQAGASSSLNVALRPASVFAGKKFDNRQLTAADALVITLMNKFDNGIGGKWQDSMASLASSACKNCTLFPHDGHVTRNKVYEFSFTPLSVSENALLAFAYGCMAIYVLVSLRRMKAFHSRFGLVFTAITQMTCSILASFTICGMLKINLSMIPQNAYPFVVLVIGLENMFRLINAVLAYPPTMATDLRIANALGDIGPVSVATAAQNLILLSGLSRLVSPGVAAFCSFACIATLFDVFFLLTFFVAVLNVDIRRFELQDALARANRSRPRRRPSPAHDHTWFDALVHGRLPFSTRMAGTAVTTTFILSLNYHFFEHREQATSLRYLWGLLREAPPTLNEFDTFAPPPMNASLTPLQWMWMQDFDTAKEVMRLAKPGADSFIIHVFAPLIVVLSGADRTEVGEQEAWTSALRSFAVHHFYPVAVAVVFIVAFVAVLMNFLLYSEPQDDQDLVTEGQSGEGLSVRTVELPHKLDIVRLAGTPKGHFVTIGLDRTIAVCRYDEAEGGHRIINFPNQALAGMKWPIRTVKLDEAATTMACHCADDQIALYSCARDRFTNHPLEYPDDTPPVLFDFAHLSDGETPKLHLVIVTSGGSLAMSSVETGGMKRLRLSETPLLGASLLDVPGQAKQLLVVTNQAELVSYACATAEWVQNTSQALPIPALHGRLTGAVSLKHHWDIGSGLLVVSTSRHAVFLDSQSLQVRGQIDVGDNEASISEVLLSQASKCPECNSVAFNHVALLHDTSSDRNCILTTLSTSETPDDAAVICLEASKPDCVPFSRAHRAKRALPKAGAWSVVTSPAVLGFRKRISPPPPPPSSSPPTTAVTTPTLRRRHHRRSSRAEPFPEAESDSDDSDDDAWEAYTLTSTGVVETTPALPSSESSSTTSDPTTPSIPALYVSAPGSAVPLTSTSIAVAFGNRVKIVRSAAKSGVGGNGSGGERTRRPTGRTLERPPPAVAAFTAGTAAAGGASSVVGATCT